MVGYLTIQSASGYQKRCQELKQRNESSGSRDKQSRLVALCRTSSNLMTGVEICVQAEDYLAGGEIDMALDRFIQINIKYLHST